jgi:hypothetical protein
MERVLAPVISSALKLYGGELNLKNLIAQALLMGDEGHNRNKAGTSLFIRELAPSIVKSIIGFSSSVVKGIFKILCYSLGMN